MSAIATRDALFEILDTVKDPEVPVLSVVELGIVRDARVDGEVVTVTLTPTYSGCPAMEAIRHDVESALADAGFADVRVRTVLAPAWSTDWISDRGRAALLEYGIAPPGPRGSGPVPLTLAVRCPHCGSPDTRELSHFGSTACKALRQCRTCREPFDHVKPL